MSVTKKILSRLKRQHGFTLLEMLTAMSVFVMITTIALGVYTSIMRANKKSVSLTRLHRDSQVIMLALAKKIRQSQVYYDYYQAPNYPTGIINPLDELALIDIDGTEYVYRLNDSINTIQVSSDGGVNFADMPAGDVEITDLRFFVTPTTDPFSVVPDQTPQFPRVTMVLRLETRNQTGIYSDYLIVQHTVPQRGGGY